MDKLAIYDITFHGHVGVTDEERKTAQKLSVDTELACDLKKASAYDRLSDAVDYEQVCEAVLKIGRGYAFHLLETLAEGIAEKILEDRKISSVLVRVRKHLPPRKEIRGGVVVEITRSQPATD